MGSEGLFRRWVEKHDLAEAWSSRCMVRKCVLGEGRRLETFSTSERAQRQNDLGLYRHFRFSKNTFTRRKSILLDLLRCSFKTHSTLSSQEHSKRVASFEKWWNGLLSNVTWALLKITQSSTRKSCHRRQNPRRFLVTYVFCDPSHNGELWRPHPEKHRKRSFCN